MENKKPSEFRCRGKDYLNWMTLGYATKNKVSLKLFLLPCSVIRWGYQGC